PPVRAGVAPPARRRGARRRRRRNHPHAPRVAQARPDRGAARAVGARHGPLPAGREPAEHARARPRDGPGGPTRGGPLRRERHYVSVMFADLQGFTALSEKLAPEVLVDVLNGYFREMSAAITANHGQLAKFMGDGLMALFGAVASNPWQARDAALAALAMRA